VGEGRVRRGLGVSVITQEGTYGRHYTKCTSMDPNFWIELGVDYKWYYLLFRIPS